MRAWKQYDWIKTKKLCALSALALLTSAFCLASASAVSAKVKIEKPKQTIYLSSKDGKDSARQPELFFYIGLSDGDRIEETSIQSDNEWASGKVSFIKPVNSDGVFLNIRPVHPGTANLSFQDQAGRAYTVTAEILPYENPLKTLKITNVKKGKNLAGKLDESRETKPGSITFSKKTDAPKIKLVCADGWKLMGVKIYVREDVTYNFREQRINRINLNARSKTIKLKETKKGDYVWFRDMRFVNEKNGASQIIFTFGKDPYTSK